MRSPTKVAELMAIGPGVICEIATTSANSVILSWESTSTTALINAVAYNLGIAVIPLRIAQAISAKEKVVILKMEDVNFQRKFSIIHHKNKFLTPSALAFLEICKQNKTL